MVHPPWQEQVPLPEELSAGCGCLIPGGADRSEHRTQGSFDIPSFLPPTEWRTTGRTLKELRPTGGALRSTNAEPSAVYSPYYNIHLGDTARAACGLLLGVHTGGLCSKWETAWQWLPVYKEGKLLRWKNWTIDPDKPCRQSTITATHMQGTARDSS
jgi:hypothetical protein